MDFTYTEKEPGVWVGENTYLDPTVKIQAPVLIGSNCRIGPRTYLQSGTVIGDNVTVGSDVELHRPIIWNGAIIGDEAQLSACVISRGTRVDRRALILEGAVIGPLSIVGEEATINTNVRVWPSKRIEPGAILNINLIWGSIAHKNLFGQRGVTGLANIDITPEFAVKLGAAYGSTLKSGSAIVVSRDQRNVSRMVSRSLISGIMSVGINLKNLESTAIPLTRTITPKLGVEGGVHVRLHPERHDHILIEFFDQNGINISKAKERKIEGAYFKEDIRRVSVLDIGTMSYPSQVIETYSDSFKTLLNVEAIRTSKAKVVIDYIYGVSGAILPLLLAEFGCDAVVLNASLRQQPISTQERENLLVQLGHVVEVLKANLGVQVYANGEQLVLVDESGIPIRDEELTALMVSTILTANPRGTVVVPIHASSAVEQIARRHDGHVIRTKANPTALMEASQQNPNVVLGGSGDMGFIFPKLHPGFDAMFTLAKLIEMLTVQERSLAQVRADLPRVCHKSITMRCPMTVKGSLMRYFVQEENQSFGEIERPSIDGVKIFERHTDNWVLILPDGGEPLLHIYANSEDREWVDQQLQIYHRRIKQFIAEYS